MSKIYKSIEDLVGKTPLIELSRYGEKNGLCAKILAKTECFNPAGSIKDRAARGMLDDAEKRGILNKDTVIIEPTSGNTGIGLSAIAAVRGYKVIIVMPDTMSKERRLLMSAYGVPSISTQYSATLGREILDSGSSLIVAGGTGNPFFTTDTAAVLRAVELQCSEVLKATKVDGVYTADPFKDKSAQKYDTLSFDEVIEKQLEVMDLTAFALARDHHMPIRVFSMGKDGAFMRAAKGESEGTLVS